MSAARRVKDRTLTATDFKAGQLPAGPQGPQGPQGDPGAQGPQGEAGAPGTSGYQIVHWTADPVNPGSPVGVQAKCPTGKRAVGGGLASGQPIAVSDSRPSEDGTLWYVGGKNMGVAPTSVAAYVICAQVG